MNEKLSAASWQRALRSGVLSAGEMGQGLASHFAATGAKLKAPVAPLVEGAATGAKDAVQGVRGALMTPAANTYTMPQALRNAALKPKLFAAQAAHPNQVGGLPANLNVSVNTIPGSEGGTLMSHKALDRGFGRGAADPYFTVQTPPNNFDTLHHELAEVHGTYHGGGVPFGTHVNERPQIAGALGSWSQNRLTNRGAELAGGTDGEHVGKMFKSVGATPWAPVPLDGRQHAAVRKMTIQGRQQGLLETNPQLNEDLVRKEWRTPAAVQAPSTKVAFELQGHTEHQGLRIAIENRKGSVRKGVDKDGKPWRTEMKHPYGYIKDTKGKDGEEIDCYVGPVKDAPVAYVVHQHKDDGTGHDEDKVMLGFKSEEHARKAYLAHYNDPKFLGPISAVPIERMKERFAEGKKIVKLSSEVPSFLQELQSIGSLGFLQ